MSRLATSFVLGYHGCDQAVADRLIRGADAIKPSSRDFDWLGAGAYFWEADPHRALEWAQGRVAQGAYKTAAIVGAVIDLGNCFDLANRENIKVFRGAYEGFVAHQKASGLPMPVNKNAKDDPDENRLLRFLDCAVFQHLHKSIEEAIAAGSAIPRFDTVRGMFTEGGEIYEGCGFSERTHVQIAVRTLDCIVGVFKPLRL